MIHSHLTARRFPSCPVVTGHFCRWAKAAGEESPSGMLLPAAGAAVAARPAIWRAALPTNRTPPQRRYPLSPRPAAFLAVFTLALYQNTTTGSIFGVFRSRSIEEMRFDRPLKGARVNRTPSDGQGLISGATPCPHFGHLGTSNGQGPHREIRPCPLKRGGRVVGDSGLLGRRCECSWSAFF